MKVKRLKRLRINAHVFKVIWNSQMSGGNFTYFCDKHKSPVLEIGTKDNVESEILEVLNHELWELICCEMRVRHSRTDCHGEYTFVYDHRQHTTMISMFTGLQVQFLQ